MESKRALKIFSTLLLMTLFLMGFQNCGTYNQMMGGSGSGSNSPKGGEPYPGTDRATTYFDKSSTCPDGSYVNVIEVLDPTQTAATFKVENCAPSSRAIQIPLTDWIQPGQSFSFGGHTFNLL